MRINSYCSLANVEDLFISLRFYIHSMKTHKFVVFVGSNSLTDGGYRHLVKRFIVHENYDKEQAANDIALIRVRQPIQFNDRVQPVPMSAEVVPENATLVVTGWGSLEVKPSTCYLSFKSCAIFLSNFVNCFFFFVLITA